MHGLGIHYPDIHPNPEVVKIMTHSPFSYYDAEKLYDISQEYDIDIGILIKSALLGVGVEEIRGALRNT